VQGDFSSFFGSSGSEDEESGEEAPKRGDFGERGVGGGKERGKDEGSRAQATGGGASVSVSGAVRGVRAYKMMLICEVW